MKSKKVTDPEILKQLNSQPKKVTDPNLLNQLNSDDNEDSGAYLDSLSSPEQGFFSKLPRNILTGLANLGHSTINTPHDVAKSFENQGAMIGNVVNKNLPIDVSALAPSPNVVEEFNKQHNVPESAKNPLYNQPLSERIPHQQDYDFAKILGQEGQPSLMDTLIQKGVEYTPEIASGRQLLKTGIGLLKGTHQLGKAEKSINDLTKHKINTNEMVNLYHGKSPELADKILKEGLGSHRYSEEYPLLTNNPNTAYEYGARTAEDTPDLLKISIPRQELGNYLHNENKNWAAQANKPRGHEQSQIFGIKQPIPSKYITKVEESNIPGFVHDISNIANENNYLNFNYPEEMINQAKKFLPKTEATKELLNQVKQGNYTAAFKLQSQIGHHQRKLAQSPLASENSIMAPKAGELKQKMLSHLDDVLRNEGLHKEADLIKSGINNYRVYKQVQNTVMPVLKKAGIPTTILAALGFGYKLLS